MQIVDKTITHKTMTQTQNHCVGILVLDNKFKLTLVLQ